jgi:hypothetical protein
VVKVLVEKTADVDAKGRLYGNALLTASAGGYKMVGDLLLKDMR